VLVYKLAVSTEHHIASTAVVTAIDSLRFQLICKSPTLTGFLLLDWWSAYMWTRVQALEHSILIAF